MPLDRNLLFVGRETDLLALARSIKGGDTVAIGQVAAATGLGGIGKTQLASEFVFRYGQYFDGGVYWLSFANPAAIPSEIAVCGGPGHLELRPDFEALSIDKQIELVLASWQSPLPRLLIFDNCEDERLLVSWRPRRGGSRVLLTSRRSQWSRVLNISALQLGVLRRNEAVELLQSYRLDLSAKDDAALNAIADELADLPLALHLAGSFLETFRHSKLGTPESYLEQLGQASVLHHPSLEGEGSTPSPTDHELSMSRTFTISFKQLDPESAIDAKAIVLLTRAAYFAPGEIIPRELLLTTLRPGSADSTPSLEEEKVLIRLVALGLLEEQVDGAVRMHRLLTEFVLGKPHETAAQNAVEDALGYAFRQFSDAGNLVEAHALEPHLRAVTDLASGRQDERVVDLCNALGTYLRLSGDYSGARRYQTQALAVREALWGENHPETALEVNNLGYIFYYQGDYEGAREYLERALPLWQQKEDYPNLAATLDNLGQLLGKQGDLILAQEFFERALALRKQALGPSHPLTAITLHNLAWNLFAQGDIEGALAAHKQAFAIRERIYKEPNQHTAASLNSLGLLLQAQGDLKDARIYLEQAFQMRKQVFGLTHSYTLATLRHLVLVISEQLASCETSRVCRRLAKRRQQTYTPTITGEARPHKGRRSSVRVARSPTTGVI